VTHTFPTPIKLSNYQTLLNIVQNSTPWLFEAVVFYQPVVLSNPAFILILVFSTRDLYNTEGKGETIAQDKG